MDILEIKSNGLFKNMVNTQFDPENSVSFEQFQTKIVICDLSGEECRHGECCIGCELAEEEVKSDLANEAIGLFPTIEKSRNEEKFKSNWNESFYEFNSINSLRRTLPHPEWISKLDNYQELPAGVKEKYHVWNECSVVIFSMYKVTGFMYMEKCPLIVMCEDRIFVEPPYE